MALTRRSFIASSAALAVAGCTSPDAAGGAADAPRLEFGGDGAFTFLQLTDLHLRPNGARRMLLAKGIAGVLKEHTCPPYWKTYRDAAHTFEGRTLYDSWRRMGNLRGAYFGHDHMNTFDGTDANGIRLGMTKCCTFWSYNDNNPGVRVFTVRPDGTYATSIFAESDCRDA